MADFFKTKPAENQIVWFHISKGYISQGYSYYHILFFVVPFITLIFNKPIAIFIYVMIIAFKNY